MVPSKEDIMEAAEEEIAFLAEYNPHSSIK